MGRGWARWLCAQGRVYRRLPIRKMCQVCLATMVKGDHVTENFAADTALTRVDATTFDGYIDRGWGVGRGVNGGYIAAIILRALGMVVADAERTPRSLTVQYVAPPAEGPVRVAVAVEHQGRSITMLSARMYQDDRLLANALSAFAKPRLSIEYRGEEMPAVPPPEELEPFSPPGFGMLTFFARYHYRWAIGAAPFSGAAQARTGGWLRFAEPYLVDYLAVAAFTDAWVPSIFPVLTTRAPVPTIDLTIHFRVRLPLPGATPDDFYFVHFQSRCASEGFFEEDGEVWSRDGTLIAQSRQLALLPPP